MVELVREARTGHLGPDLCTADADLDEVVRRMGALDPVTPLADVLLDQRICCGVGNVYKSEVPFALGLHPLHPDRHSRRATSVGRSSTPRRGSCGRTSRTSSRTTMTGPPGTLGVYGRRGEPCRRCGTPIAWARTGRHARGTYWCPTCQPEAPTPA